MQRRVLQGLDWPVSAVAAGCWTIGGPATNNGVPIGWDDVDLDIAYAALIRAYYLGVTVFDTADVYGLGRSERLLGRLLGHVGRDHLIVSSKVGYFAGTGPHPYHPEQMRHQFTTTLANLGADYLDVYHLHSVDFGADDRYLAGAVDMLRGLRDQGRIRAIGMRAPHVFAQQRARGDGPEAMQTARWLRLFDIIQPDVLTVRYNLLSPLYDADETDIFDFARQHSIAVLIKQALGQGTFLRTATAPIRTFSPGDHRSRDPQFQPERLATQHARLAPIRTRFGDSPIELARVALGYALSRDPHAAVLVGFRDPSQIGIAVTCVSEPLPTHDIDWIRTALHSTVV
jgi:aryl-alcohol dehydrogenase-like predicted oxidoreductase